MNLARFRTRAGDGIGAHQLLADLHHAVTHRAATTIDGLEVRADAWGADVTQQPELNQWLRGVLITDGTRALVTAGRWTPAADHARRYGGLTTQLHDGRQVAILAALLADDDTATELLLASVPEQPWEHAIRAVLLAMCNEPVELSGEQGRNLLALAAAPELTPGNGLAVYRTRLGLTTIDLTAPGYIDDSEQLAHRLCADALADQDGHAVKDLLDHHAVPTMLDCDLRTFYECCGLQRGELPATVLDNLQHALRLVAGTIQFGA